MTARIIPFLACACAAMWPLMSRSVAVAEEKTSVHIAVLVGSGRYQGETGLPDLEYADDDVLRFVQTLQYFVHPNDMSVLVEPDPQVADALRRLHITRWDAPTVDALIERLGWVESRTRALRAARGDDVTVRVTLFFSAHGDALGIHLADGILSGQRLQAYLDDLTADTVLVVADACFSAQWLALKGETATASGRSGPVDERSAGFPLDAVAEALQHLDRVGAITSQSVTREERMMVRGGLVTHVVASALQGAADLDQDRRISYTELSTFLSYYGARIPMLEKVLVHAPRTSPERPPILIESGGLRPVGLRFPARDGNGEECFWVTDDTGRLVAELCKRQEDERRVSLAEGSYNVQRFTPDSWLGREGKLEVSVGYTPVQEASLTGWWFWPGRKGTQLDAVSLPESARPLTEAEVSYRNSSPFRSAVSWKDLPGRQQLAIKLGASAGLLGFGARAAGESGRADSLTQEQPFVTLAGVYDWRWRRQGGAYLCLGTELEAAASIGNQVGYGTSDQTVVRALYRARVTLERPRGLWGLRFGLAAGGFSAAPWSGGRARNEDTSEAYRLWFGASVGLPVEIDVPTRGGRRFVVGLSPELAIEPQIVGENALRLAPFGGMSFSIGMGW